MSAARSFNRPEAAVLTNTRTTRFQTLVRIEIQSGVPALSTTAPGGPLTPMWEEVLMN